MIGMEHYGAAGVQLGVYFCVSGTAGMGIAYDLSLDIRVLGFPCAAEPAWQASVNSSSRSVSSSYCCYCCCWFSDQNWVLVMCDRIGGATTLRRLNQQWLDFVHNSL